MKIWCNVDVVCVLWRNQIRTWPKGTLLLWQRGGFIPFLSLFFLNRFWFKVVAFRNRYSPPCSSHYVEPDIEVLVCCKVSSTFATTFAMALNLQWLLPHRLLFICHLFRMKCVESPCYVFLIALLPPFALFDVESDVVDWVLLSKFTTLLLWCLICNDWINLIQGAFSYCFSDVLLPKIKKTWVFCLVVLATRNKWALDCRLLGHF